MNQLLLEYMRTHEIPNNMVYKQSAIDQMIFVRDTLCGHLLRVPVFVVSTHRSKSIQLPVYYFEMRNGIRALMRENFYGWVVSLITPFSVTIEDFCYGDGAYPHNKDIASCFAEGFKSSWVFPYIKENTRNTTFKVDGNYKLYTLFYLLNRINVSLHANRYVIKNKEIASLAMNQLTENHPDVQPWELFSRPCYMAENDRFCKEYGLDRFISLDDTVKELSDRIGLWDELDVELSIELDLLRKGEQFE